MPLILLTGFAPRLAAVLYWIVKPVRGGTPRSTAPGSGRCSATIFLPITTIVWVLVSPGGVASFDFLWLGIAVFLDLGSTARSAARPNG